MLFFKQIKAFGDGQVAHQVFPGLVSPITNQGVEPTLFTALRACSCAVEIPQRPVCTGLVRCQHTACESARYPSTCSMGFTEMPQSHPTWNLTLPFGDCAGRKQAERTRERGSMRTDQRGRAKWRVRRFQSPQFSAILKPHSSLWKVCPHLIFRVHLKALLLDWLWGHLGPPWDMARCLVETKAPFIHSTNIY